jgi:hypothetical protein
MVSRRVADERLHNHDWLWISLSSLWSYGNLHQQYSS